MPSNSQMIKKLQTALNVKGCRILYNTTQFYSEELQRPITLHCIKQSTLNKESGRKVNVELFKSSSMIQVVLFLRDLLFKIEGKEIPTDNEVWNRMKEEYKEKGMTLGDL